MPSSIYSNSSKTGFRMRIVSIGTLDRQMASALISLSLSESNSLKIDMKVSSFNLATSYFERLVIAGLVKATSSFYHSIFRSLNSNAF